MKLFSGMLGQPIPVGTVSIEVSAESSQYA